MKLPTPSVARLRKRIWNSDYFKRKTYLPKKLSFKTFSRPRNAKKEDRCSISSYSCPICLEVLSQPVTLSCGHNYDRECITEAVIVFERSKIENKTDNFHCPTCRDVHPDARNSILKLKVNTLLDSLVQAAFPVEHAKQKLRAKSRQELDSYIASELQSVDKNSDFSHQSQFGPLTEPAGFVLATILLLAITLPLVLFPFLPQIAGAFDRIVTGWNEFTSLDAAGVKPVIEVLLDILTLLLI